MDSPIRDVHEDVLKLQAYFESRPDGEQLSYLRIEHDTGVIMDRIGKQRIPRAMKRCGKVYRTIYGEGIEMGSPDNAVPILVNQTDRITGAVRRLDKKHKIIEQAHVEKMNEGQRKICELIGCVLGAFKKCGNLAKRIYGQPEPKLITTIRIPFPGSEQSDA